MDVVLVILDPGLNGKASFPNVDLTAFTGHAVYIRNLEPEVLFQRPNEAVDLRG
jgi:hypothetical protein